MEELHELLVNYNTHNIKEKYQCSWSKQFCELTFPMYWQKVFEILRYESREQRVVEIGCGQGDVTSIFCYLGFKNIKAFERDADIAEVAKEKISTLFSLDDIIVSAEFPQSPIVSDILILVNCAYDDGVKTKEEYLHKLKGFYNYAGTPGLFILEVVDSSYTIEDENFPYQIRLDSTDIESLFPNSDICSWETYRYPQNKRTKRLYLIRKKL